MSSKLTELKNDVSLLSEFNPALIFYIRLKLKSKWLITLPTPTSPISKISAG